MNAIDGTPRIGGATRLFAIIGDPIAQVRSPAVYSARFAAEGIDAVMIPVHVPAARFDAIVPALLGVANLDAIVVTVPFKARMLAFADRLGATASCIGALNALRREADGTWTGDMFDGEGFVEGARRKGLRVEGRRVALFGAGGAGSAIACALAKAGVHSVTIIDCDAARARALEARLAVAFADVRFECSASVPGASDMVVNATPVGMDAADGLPGAIDGLAPGSLIGDVVIRDESTPIIRLAERQRLDYVNGKDMHAGQADALMRFLVPSRAPR
ncbi:MAG TPA: ThiF family adenylyltransferase [Casimicrobiaceae bacterium]|nr:ThiF family adenylyltransferase [Casimicrobiaceae bacterium]